MVFVSSIITDDGVHFFNPGKLTTHVFLRNIDNELFLFQLK